MQLRRYTPDMSARWDEFIHSSSNGTFLHLRGYMDYHAHRFADHSLMAYDRKGRLVAVLAANEDDHTLYSHQGLTYGGWVTATRHFSSGDMLELWDKLKAYLAQVGFKRLVYKAIPWIYARYPSDDDLYALFRNGATVDACLVASVVSPYEEPLLNKRASRQIKSAESSAVEVRQSNDYPSFMAMLSERLHERYGAVPVHTLNELTLLASRFPHNIHLVMAYSAGSDKPCAGTVIYESHRVMHCQYIATNEEGRSNFAFSAIASHLIHQARSKQKYLDFGTSNEQRGQILNATLNEQKYGLSGRPTAYITYALEI